MMAALLFIVKTLYEGKSAPNELILIAVAEMGRLNVRNRANDVSVSNCGNGAGHALGLQKS